MYSKKSPRDFSPLKPQSMTSRGSSSNRIDASRRSTPQLSTPPTERAPGLTTSIKDSLRLNESCISDEDKTPVPVRRFQRAPDPLDEKIRRIQESIHDEDDRPSVTVVVENRNTKSTKPPPSKPGTALLIGKITAGLAVAGALAECVRQLVQLLGGH